MQRAQRIAHPAHTNINQVRRALTALEMELMPDAGEPLNVANVDAALAGLLSHVEELHAVARAGA